MHGDDETMVDKIIIADADILVSLAYKSDSNHKRARNITEKLSAKLYNIFFPNTAILEAITALKRGLNQPVLANLINQQYQQGSYNIIYIDEKTQLAASRLFEEKSRSKHHTIFDALVATVAEEYSADAIFSFDKWYKELGKKLAQNLL